MAHQVETLAYAKDRGVPWHGLGTAVETAMTSSEAAKLGGLLWNVEKRPLYTKLNDGSITQVPDRFATVRDSDERILGVVTNEYEVFQNADAFRLIDDLLGEFGIAAAYETAMSLRNGEVVAIAARLPKPIKISKREVQQAYLMLRTGHDGGHATDIVPTAVRPVCWNTVTMAVNARGPRGADGYGVTLWHMGTMAQKLAMAKDALTLALSRIDDYGATMAKLIDTPATPELEERVQRVVIPRVLELPQGRRDIVALLPEPDMRKYVQVVTPDAFIRAAKLQEKKDVAWASIRKQEDGSAYGLFNAVTGYVDHGRPRMWGGEHRFNTALFGEGARLKDAGLREIRSALNI